MVTSGLPVSKQNGVFYTSSTLAKFFVRPVLGNAECTIFDPAYGNGSLLLAAEAVLREGKRPVNRKHFFGCDNSPDDNRMGHFPKSNFTQIDFFDYPTEKKFDVVVMNPPFVRHHYMDRRKREKYQKIVSGTLQLSGTSDLWGYFLVKAVEHLKRGGSIGAILPWSFLQSDYSHRIRTWLSKRFGYIKILSLGAPLFNGVEERIVLVWLKQFGNPVASIQAAFSHNIENLIRYQEVSINQFTDRKMVISGNSDIKSVIDEYIDRHGFQEFSNYADISIGIVTGADEFFILDKERVGINGFSKSHLIPIYTSSRAFSGLSVNGNYPSHRLICITPENRGQYRVYINKGVKEGYNLRAHSMRRKPWYQVRMGNPPDAFFPYRVSQIPYLVLNDKRVQCTNSIHRIYFKNVSEMEKRWIQISLLSVPGQLSLELNSKVYGSGLLKVEPASLKRALTIKIESKDINSVYGKISRLLSLQKKSNAMDLATNFIDIALNVSSELSNTAKSLLGELQDRRLSKKNRYWKERGVRVS